jgi:hypothetical protein
MDLMGAMMSELVDEKNKWNASWICAQIMTASTYNSVRPLRCLSDVPNRVINNPNPTTPTDAESSPELVLGVLWGVLIHNSTLASKAGGACENWRYRSIMELSNGSGMTCGFC